MIRRPLSVVNSRRTSIFGSQEMVAAPLNFKIFALGDSVDDDYLDRVVDYLVNALAIRPPRHD